IGHWRAELGCSQFFAFSIAARDGFYKKISIWKSATAASIISAPFSAGTWKNLIVVFCYSTPSTPLCFLSVSAMNFCRNNNLLFGSNIIT
ncbi:hypothetical protein, partial [Caldilinea sp.]|uniref:hypothetical protein n=1 Tax=Caldilinea sp. TaxID=2293560 RepID=UPI001B202C25